MVISNIKTDLDELVEEDVKISEAEVSPALELDSDTSEEEDECNKSDSAAEVSEDIGETDEEDDETDGEEDEDSFVEEDEHLELSAAEASSEEDCSEAESEL